MIQIAAERILARPGHEPAVADATIVIDGDVAAAIAASATAAAGRGLLAMPALANAHDHGRGMSTLLIGAADEALELWLPGLAGHPSVAPYVVNGLAFARMARSGCSSILHCHVPQAYGRLPEEAAEVARAAADIGVRVGFVVPMRDRNRLVIGDNDAFLARLDAPLREAIARTWLGPLPDARGQLDLADSIAGQLQGPRFDVQYGPVAPHWCSDTLLAGVAEASARTGRRGHMHLLETRYQRAWADTAYEGGLVAHLDRLGILSPRLTVAHCVWLRPAEMELFAERGVTIAVNTSSNLRLRSGIAPLAGFHGAGLAVAFGMDGMALDDDTDMFRELRLTRLLHAGSGLEEGVSPARLLDGALGTGHAVAGGIATFGAIAPGAAADIAVLDLAGLTYGGVPGALDETEIVLGRATQSHVRHLVVAGRDVVVDGRVVGVDEAAMAAEIDAAARRHAEQWSAFAPICARFRSAIRGHYRQGRHKGPFATG